jgi:hypothetical protein
VIEDDEPAPKKKIKYNNPDQLVLKPKFIEADQLVLKPKFVEPKFSES